MFEESPHVEHKISEMRGYARHAQPPLPRLWEKNDAQLCRLDSLLIFVVWIHVQNHCLNSLFRFVAQIAQIGCPDLLLRLGAYMFWLIFIIIRCSESFLNGLHSDLATGDSLHKTYSYSDSYSDSDPYSNSDPDSEPCSFKSDSNSDPYSDSDPIHIHIQIQIHVHMNKQIQSHSDSDRIQIQIHINIQSHM